MRRERPPGTKFHVIAAAVLVAAAALLSFVPGTAGAAQHRALAVPDHLTFSIATPVTAGSNFTVTVTARDSGGNKMTSYNGSATWSDLSGTISPSPPSSFVNGVSSTSANVPAPFHDDRITITTSGVTKQSGQFNVIGPFDHITVAKVTGVPTPGTNFAVTARAYDAANTLLTSYNASATWSDTSGTMTGAPTSFVNGVSSGSAQIPTPQHDDSLHVVSGAKAGDSPLFNVVGPLDHLVVHGLINANAGTTLTVNTTAYDSANNFLNTYNAPATWSDLSGGLSPSTPASFVNGMSSTNATFSTPFRGDRLQIVTGGVTGKSQLFNVLGPLHHFTVTAPAGPILTGTNFTVTTRAFDAVNNPLVTYGGSPTWSDLSGTLTPSGPAPFVNGVSVTTNAVVSTPQLADTITVTDGTKTGTSNAFDVTLNPDNAPTDISLSNASVNENLPSGTTVGTLSTTDPDAGDTFTYSLVGGTGSDDNSSFQIVGDTLKTNAVFNFEAKSSYTIRVRSTDSGSLFFEKQFAISINNVNDTPTNILLSANTINENLPSGTTIGTLSAIDQDAGQTYSFSLQSTGCGGGPFADNSSFSITSNSLKSAVAFNFETKSSYSICVRTTDDGSPNLSFDKQFTITIVDVNDAPSPTNDSYSGAIGNTKAQLGTSSAGPVVTLTGNVLTNNDTDEDATFPHTLSAVPETNATTGGGSVTIGSDGSFVYTPGVGDKNQNDTFTYHVTDGTLTSAGTATVHIENFLVWYVDRDAAVNGDGRSSSPLNNLAGINGAGGSGDADGSGDIIFLYSSAVNYTGGLPLESSQQLLGEPAGLTVNGNALVAAGGSNPVITNASGTGVGLVNGVDVQGVNITGTTGDGINGSSVTTATVGTTTAVNISTSGGDGVDLSGAAGGNISIAAPISGSVGHSITVSGRSSGTVAFTGAITDNGTGISLSSNTGATINLTGGVTASTLASNAFSATGGGTVSVTGANNTLTTTLGTALTVSGTTIGASGLTFKSISANGAANGIFLSNTGSSGGLTVTGDGSNTSLGGNATGGTISNATGADGATAGIGVYLNNTSSVSLRRMTINGTNQNFGIYGSGVNGLTLEYSTVGGTEGTSTGFDEGSIIFDGLTGTSTFTKLAISGSIEDNFRIRNSSGTSDVTIDGSTFTNAPNDNLIIEPSSTATVTAHVTNNVFTGAGGDHFQTATSNSATLNVVFTGNSYSNGFAGSLLGGITISGGNLGSSEHVNFNISNNGTVGTPLVGSVQGGAININEGQGGGTWQGQVSNNFIGNGSVANSGASQSSGIRVENHSTSGTLTAIISNNTVKQWNNGPAINTQAGDAGNASNTGVLNVTVTGNTSTNPGASSQHGFVANIGAGSGSGTAADVACVDPHTNTLDGNTGNGGAGVRVRQRESSTVKIPGYTGTQYDSTAVATYLQSLNSGSVGTATASTSSAGPGYANTSPPGSACPQPTVPS